MAPVLNKYSVSLASHVSIHLLIHCQLISIIITTLIIHHSFTLLLQAQNLPFQQILSTLDFFYLPDCLHDKLTTGLDWTYQAIMLIVRFNFLFVLCCGRSWLPVSFLLHVKYTLRPVARLPSVGCVSERRRREDRGAAGAEGVGTGEGVPLPLGRGLGAPQKA